MICPACGAPHEFPLLLVVIILATVAALYSDGAAQ